MDSLAKRYASPFVVLDEMIHQGRLLEFVLELWKIEDEEKTWEVWLHKVYDKTWKEWKEDLKAKARAREASESELEATVTNSKQLLDGFNPQPGG